MREYVRPIADDTNEANFCLAASGVATRDGLMDHLIDRAELNIMDLENVDVVGAQAAQRAFKPSDHSRFAEIELVKSISATFRTQHHFVPASIQHNAFF
jgi:hypothetical protein